MILFLLNCQGSRQFRRNNIYNTIRFHFTIQLIYGSSGHTQNVSIGVDLGAKHIGLAIQSNNKILLKSEIELRQDIKSNLDTRKIYRRSRRNRKTRYRKARFSNRISSKKEGWLPPSIKSRIDNTFMFIDKFISLTPKSKLNIEVGKFDVQKMENPNIQGIEYQQGESFGFYDTRYYVFARDNYTCQVCKKKNKILRTHHLVYTSNGGTNRANNLITICTDCHTSENHKEGSVLYKWMIDKKKTPKYKEPPFMNTLRKRVFNKYPNAKIVYGSFTTPKRKELKLEKTHYNDALVISGIENNFMDKTNEVYKIKQFRKKKRSLHEATARKGRKQPNVFSKRNEKNTKFQNGFFLNDKVYVFNKTGWISGFCKGGCYVKDVDNNYITVPNKNYKQLTFSPQLKQGDS